MNYDGYQREDPLKPNCQDANNEYDYLCSFGGTSAACPMVAGIASLLISRDSTLTAFEIYDIIRYSAVTELDWGNVITPHIKYGYGRVNAMRALLAITRGDADNSGGVNLGDAGYILNYIYYSGNEPMPHLLTGDANCDGSVNIADGNFIINYIFYDGPEPQICFEY